MSRIEEKNHMAEAAASILVLMVLLAIVAVAVYFILKKKKSGSGGGGDNVDQSDPLALYDSPHDGILVHMISSEMVRQYYLEPKDFDFPANSPAICDCSPGPLPPATTPPYKGTCSAWTLMQKMLLPATLNNPINVIEADKPIEELTLTIGVIVNVDKIKKYISSMSTVDSDTNHRSCGQNFYPETASAIFACGQPQNMLSVPGNADSACPSDCVPGSKQYDRCRLQNSGGGVNISNYGCDFFNLNCKNGTQSPDMLSQWDCSKCTARGETTPEILKSKCPIAQMPQICVAQDTPSGKTKSPGAWSYQSIDDDPVSGGLQASNYVSANGDAFGALASITATTSLDPKTTSKGLNDPYDVSVLQCKFNYKDWGVWLSSIRQIYQAWYDNYSADGKSIKTAWSSGTNYLLGCNPWIYLENEVNLYFRPFSDPEKDYNKEQDKDLQDAVIGFLYVGRTCLDMMKGLEGVECSVPYSSETRTTAADRCEAFACPKDAPYTAKYPREDCISKYVTDESKDIPARQKLAHALCNRFNQKFGKNVSTYEYIGQTSAYMRREDLEAVLKGNGVPVSEVLKKEPFMPTSEETLESLRALPPRGPAKSWRQAQAAIVASGGGRR